MEPIGDRLSPWKAIELLWPLNDMFRARLRDIRGLPYSTEFEAEADTAIEAYADEPGAGAWAKISPGAWRVLLERHLQALAHALMGQATGNFIMEIPAGLPEYQQRAALMLVWLHGMKLPTPPADRSLFELPEGGPPESWRPH